MVDIIVKYWVQWLCGIVALGVTFFAKNYVKLKKKELENLWKERENKAKDEVINKLETELEDEAKKSEAADRKINGELEALSLSVESLENGILSILGKQFREMCETLLSADHSITIQEYE